MKKGELSRGLAALFLGGVVSMGGADIVVAHEPDQTTQDNYSDHFSGSTNSTRMDQISS